MIASLLQGVSGLSGDGTTGDSEKWDISSALSTMSSQIASTLSIAMIGLGVIVMVAGLCRVFTSSVRGHGPSGWPMVIGGLGISGVAIVFPTLFRSIGGAALDSTASPTPGAPSATSSPEPSAMETQAPAPEPIRLPEVENLGFLWLVLAGVAVLVVALFVVHRVTRERRDMRKQKELEQALRARVEAKWAEVVSQHDALKRKVLFVEEDWVTAFERPCLSDPTVPETAAMLRAMAAADLVGAEMPLNVDESTDLTKLPYPKAVSRFALAWAKAEAHAERVGTSGIPLEERRKIKLIRQLLEMAESSGSSPSEREVSYLRAQAMIKELTSVHVPQRAFAAIEQRQRLMIEA